MWATLKGTSMESVSAGVFDKNEELKKDMMYLDIYNCIC